MTDASLCILVGCSIVMLALVKVLPETMQRIVNGSSMANGSALVGAAAAVSGAVGVAALGVLGAGSVMGNAVRLAGAQVDAADAKAAEASGGDAPQRSRISRAAAMTGYTAGNLVSAPLADVGRRLSGQQPRHGLATWRMNADLANRNRLLQGDTSKPASAARWWWQHHQLKAGTAMTRPLKAPALDPDNPHSAVYLAARREWNERYGSYIAQAHAWRLTALASLGVAFVAVVGIAWIGAQSRIVPYVVQTDKLGDAIAVSRADVSAPADPRLIRAQLARWVDDVRSVYVDVAAEKHLITEAYAMVDRNAAAGPALNDWFAHNDPFKRAQDDSVGVAVESVLPLSGNTWRVEWREDRRTRQGALELVAALASDDHDQHQPADR